MIGDKFKTIITLIVFSRRMFMPYQDGTGPLGFGPGTGRGRGWRRKFTSRRMDFGIRRIGFFGSLIPVAVAAIRDLANPSGFLRSTTRKLIARKPEDLKKPVDASYSILDESCSRE
ncbi:MAG: hypothetical protein GF350_00070 [Chitinivibrionales bacterium]|nr:hypothetical protein [Chitinivibrionales bacterium]